MRLQYLQLGTDYHFFAVYVKFSILVAKILKVVAENSQSRKNKFSK